MNIGVPKEIKNLEHRVGLTPTSVKELTSRGHSVFVQSNAGTGINFSDDDYIAAGAKIISTAQEIFETCDLIIKVKEPLESEYTQLRENQILFTYLHLAADKKQAEGLINSKCIAIAYETVTDNKRTLPLLTPMSEVAGRLATQTGAHYLQKHMGGTGRLIGGVSGVPPAKVTIIGGGVSGFNAAQMAVGLSADVTILDRSLDKIRELETYFSTRAHVEYSTEESLEHHIKSSDLVIGAVLIPGASAPKLVKKDWLKDMQNGSVMVDIAIDQGGCFETSRATTHNDPVYEVDGVIHYCVTNMPGAVPLTSTIALNNATLPFILEIAEKGVQTALTENAHLKNGLNVYKGEITHKGVADSLNFEYVETPSELRE